MTDMPSYRLFFTGFLTLCLLFPAFSKSSAKQKRKNLPQMVENEEGKRTLTLPDPLWTHLNTEFPGFHIPDESEYDPEMLKYYHRNLIGIHPAITWGDFNQDKKRDFALLVATSETPWGPLVELVVLNGERKRGKYKTFRLGEIYKFNDQYISFKGKKLYKGKYRKGGWYINWNKEKKAYIILKS